MDESTYPIFCARPSENWFKVTLQNGKPSDKITYDEAAMAPNFLSLVKKTGAKISLGRDSDGRLLIAKKYYKQIRTDSGDIVSGTISQDVVNRLEGQFLEYKTSIVFPPNTRGSSGPNIPLQLEVNIMKEIAAFANTSGGTLFVGIDDKTKQFTGIERDLRETLELRIPTHGVAQSECRPYPQSNDGYELIIREAVKIHLKRLSAGDFIHISFWKGEGSGKTICRIDVDPFYSEHPLYLQPNQGYFVRFGNQAKHISEDLLDAFLSQASDRFKSRPSPFFRFSGRATLAFYSDGKAFFNGWRKTDAQCLGVVHLPERLESPTRSIAIYADGTAACFDATEIARRASPDGEELDSPLQDSGSLVAVLQLDHDNIPGDDSWIVVQFRWQRIMAAFKSFQPMKLLRDKKPFERVPFLPSEEMTIRSCDVIPDEDMQHFSSAIKPTIKHWYHGPMIQYSESSRYSWMHKPESSDLGSLVSLVPPMAWSDFQDFLRTGAGTFCERAPQWCRIVKCDNPGEGSLVFPNRHSVLFDAAQCRDLTNWTILDIPADHRDTRVIFVFSDGSAFARMASDLLQEIQGRPLDFAQDLEELPVSVLLARAEDILVTITKFADISLESSDWDASIDDVACEERENGDRLFCYYDAKYRYISEIPVFRAFSSKDDHSSDCLRGSGDQYVFDAGILRKETMKGLSIEEWKKERTPDDPRCPLSGIDIGSWSTYGENPGLMIATMDHD